MSFQQMGKQLAASYVAIKLDELTAEVAKLTKAIEHLKK